MPEAYDLIEQGKIQDLADLNRFFAAWLEVAYHQKVHNTFKQRPADHYRKCTHPLRRIPPHELVEVFLLEEARKVDKTNCIALLGMTYEVEPGLAGEKVQLRFDPYDMSVIQVWKDGLRHQDACILQKRSMRGAKASKPSPPHRYSLNPNRKPASIMWNSLTRSIWPSKKQRPGRAFATCCRRRSRNDSSILWVAEHPVYARNPDRPVVPIRFV